MHSGFSSYVEDAGQRNVKTPWTVAGGERIANKAKPGDVNYWYGQSGSKSVIEGKTNTGPISSEDWNTQANVTKGEKPASSYLEDPFGVNSRPDSASSEFNEDDISRKVEQGVNKWSDGEGNDSTLNSMMMVNPMMAQMVAMQSANAAMLSSTSNGALTSDAEKNLNSQSALLASQAWMMNPMMMGMMNPMLMNSYTSEQLATMIQSQMSWIDWMTKQLQGSGLLP